MNEPLFPYMLKRVHQCKDLLFPSPYKIGSLTRSRAYQHLRRLNNKLDERILSRLHRFWQFLKDVFGEPFISIDALLKLEKEIVDYRLVDEKLRNCDLAKLYQTEG
ncbi:MAG: hypothetical protein OEW71_00760 [Candidatus Bathyarchaeota archaeon]|nr:hypothetical protein [Candidatus Bathyarchaeota archaeon]